jgi:DNA-directed RNA polymerase specialized sigma24 family protein
LPSNFRERKEHELYGLSDEEIIRYIRAAVDAGRVDAAKPALAVLVYGYIDIVTQRVRLKVPNVDVEDVAAIAVESAAASAFDGRSVGEFRRWLHTIVDRRIADYHKRRRLKQEPLPTEHLGDEQVWGDEPAVEFEGGTGDVRHALVCAFEELKPEHAEVVRLYLLGPHAAAEAAVRVPGMTEDNVHQIASRFQRRFRELLEARDTPP